MAVLAGCWRTGTCLNHLVASQNGTHQGHLINDLLKTCERKRYDSLVLRTKQRATPHPPLLQNKYLLQASQMNKAMGKSK